MATLSRALRRWDLTRLAAVSLGVAVLTLLLSYAVAVATSSQATSGGVISALALLAIAGSGLLYAWRPGAGGIVD
jgi:NADH:ubiquinone oxidoreductase subunit 3 (subunit A)